MAKGGKSSAAYVLKTSPYSSHAALLAALPAPGRSGRVLDLGCADGYLGAILASRGYRVVGVERSGVVTGAFAEGVELIEADLSRGLPRLDGGFDFVLCADILEHLPDPLCLLRQLPGVLNPGGALLASLPNSANVYFRLVVLFGEFPQEDRGLFDRTHLRFYNWAGWREVLNQGGFTIRSVQPTAIPVGLVFPRWQDFLPVKLTEWLCYVSARLWKSLFAYQFVITAWPTAAVTPAVSGDLPKRSAASPS